jgi:hypothetical protein
MAQAIGKIVASNGEYEVDGVKKKRWQKIGTLFQDNQTAEFSMKIDAIPVGPEWSGWAKVFPLDERKAE